MSKILVPHIACEYENRRHILISSPLHYAFYIHSTAQSVQGINPNTRPADRGGFPSGGADLPSFSLIPVQKVNVVERFIGSSSNKNSKESVKKESK
jgi:hypothetical protein